jgi:hypothetical protein
VQVVAQPLIAVADVEASSSWYCHVLGGTSGHGGREYELGAELLEDRHPNPGAHHEEIWLRDPDGYVVVLASRPDGADGEDG